MTENASKLMPDTNQTINAGNARAPNKVTAKATISRHIIVKFQKIKDKRKNPE